MYPRLSSLSVPHHNPSNLFALVEVAKLMFRLSAVSTVRCPRLMNFGLSLRTEFVSFTRTLESGFFQSSGKILFTPTSLICDDYRFLSWVVERWMKVSDFLTLSVQLSTFEVVSLLGLQISLFSPGVSILLLRSPLLFLLSLDMHIIFLFLSTDSSCGPITDASDWSVLSQDEFVLNSCLIEFVKTFVTRFVSMFVSPLIMRWLMPCSMIPILMTSGLRGPTPTDTLWTLSTMWVSFIGSFLASTCLLESLIVSTCSSKS